MYSPGAFRKGHANSDSIKYLPPERTLAMKLRHDYGGLHAHSVATVDTLSVGSTRPL
ncbi:hypothetical protein PSAB6_100270 [Paraburkholderia sabiae]|nr:hypothetical protein PSAB6_100270 [Paraburkholderia sabiae]